MPFFSLQVFSTYHQAVLGVPSCDLEPRVLPFPDDHDLGQPGPMNKIYSDLRLVDIGLEFGIKHRDFEYPLKVLSNTLTYFR